MDEGGIALGTTVRDKVTGVTGKVIARATYLHGSTRVQVSGFDPSGKLFSDWFEEAQVEVAQ